MTLSKHICVLAICFGLTSCAVVPDAPKGDTLISGGRIVDTQSGGVSDPRDVLLAGDRIVRIAEAGVIKTSSAIEVIDATGLFLLPGLMDVHAHIGDGGSHPNTPEDRRQAMQQYVRYGVTSIFAAGGGGANDTHLREWKTRCRSNPTTCPRVFGSGSLITAYGGHPIGTFWRLPADTDPAEIEGRGAVGFKEGDSARDLIDRKLAAGVDALKIIVEDGFGGRVPTPRLSRDQIAGICSEATGRDLRVYAHVGKAEHVKDVVAGGCHAIMHSPGDRIEEAVFRDMASKRIFYVATLSLFDALADRSRGDFSQDQFALAGVSAKALESTQTDRYRSIRPAPPFLLARWENALG